MTRTEYRLFIQWPDGYGYPKHIRQQGKALVEAARYRSEGAQVTIEVWRHAGEDRQAGWYRDTKATTQLASIGIIIPARRV